MPDGEASPKEQIELEVVVDKTLRAAASLFGVPMRPHTGGGDNSGKWVFADDQELTAIITQWEAVRDRIDERRTRIERARNTVRSPAFDVMSNLQVEAFKQSMFAMQAQAEAMHQYAQAYITKLRTAQRNYRAVEGQNTTRFKGPHG